MQQPKPLPRPDQPIAGSIPPSQRYGEYFQSADATLRALLANVPNVQTASYTLALSDAAGVVEMNVAGANNLTVPPNSGVPFKIGNRIQVRQIGAGTTTIVAGAGVTIHSRVGLVSNGQYAVFYLDKRGADEWVASGDL